MSVQDALGDMPVIDREVFDELSSMIGDDIFEIVDDFVEHIPPQLHALRQATLDSRAGSVKQIAHQLKSSSANLGAALFSSLCRQLEAQTDDGVTDQTIKQIEQMEAAFEQTKNRFIEIKHCQGAS